MLKYGLHIAGEWTDPDSGEWLDAVDPYREGSRSGHAPAFTHVLADPAWPGLQLGYDSVTKHTVRR